MPPFPKVSRAAVAALLALSAVAVTSGTSAAQPPPTGSLVDNGNGSVTMTYDGPSELWYVTIFEEGTACPVGTEESPGDPAEFFAATFGLTGVIPPWQGLTSVTLSEGSDVGLIADDSIVPLPAGTYQFCLVTLVDRGEGGTAFYSVAEVEAEISEPAPTTTTTTTAPEPTTTTTEAPVAPVTPRYTG